MALLGETGPEMKVLNLQIKRAMEREPNLKVTIASKVADKLLNNIN